MRKYDKSFKEAKKQSSALTAASVEQNEVNPQLVILDVLIMQQNPGVTVY